MARARGWNTASLGGVRFRVNVPSGTIRGSPSAGEPLDRTGADCRESRRKRMARERSKSRNPWDAAGAGPAGASPRPGAGVLLLAVAGLVLLTTLVYWNGVRGEFLGPDHALFQRGPFTELPAGPGAGSTLPHWLPRA